MAEHAEYTVAAETYRHYKRGDTVKLRQHVAEKLTKEGVVKPTSEKQSSREADGVSPVHDLDAEAAKEAVGRKTSPDVLKAVIDHDKRVTVQKAAEERLAELNKK